MICEQTNELRWPDSGDGALEMITTQQPDRCDAQLLRSLAHPGLKLAGYAHEHLPRLVEIGMLAGQRNRGLARMGGRTPH